MVSSSATRETADSSPVGATLSTAYVSLSQTAVVIDVEDLREFQSSMKEEFWTFSFGGFLASGSFWLGLERFFTLDRPGSDPLFLVCIVALIAGIVIGFVASRQLGRRKSKIGRIIEAAEAASTPKSTGAKGNK